MTVKDKPAPESGESPSGDYPSFFARQHSTVVGGVGTAMHCPFCGSEILGTYLPVFKCPFCGIFIFRDGKGKITMFEYKKICPECGHSFSVMITETPFPFPRIYRERE